MKLIDGDKLRKHLEYVVQKDKNFANMCSDDTDFDRQRKYCFEANALAYELCMMVMDYYIIPDENKWVSVDDRLPDESGAYLGVVDGEVMEVNYSPKTKGLICVWSTCNADGFTPLTDSQVTHWMPLPEPPNTTE